MDFYLLHTTYPILFLSVFARQLCLPVPAILFLLAGGALTGSGKLSLIGILVVAILGCLLGDLIWFEAGRRSGKRVLRLLCALALDPSVCIRQSRSTFARKGLPVLLFAKFVPGLDGITPPLAGIAGASRRNFLLFDAGGSAAWAGAYIGTGFLFASQLEKIARYTSVVANALILVLGVPLVIFFVWKLLQLIRIVRWLRPLHITPEQLQTRMNAGEEFALVDLLRFEDDPEDYRVIPGSIRADPAKLRSNARIVMPDGLEMVLYCEGENDFVSARVAAVLRRRGIRHIRVLSGGLTAWKALEYPLAPPLADPRGRARQLGVQIIPSPWGEEETNPAAPES